MGLFKMADKYWVGGTGNFSDYNNHWSTTSGGAPGATLPNNADNVFFDVNSSINNASYTFTIDTAASVLGLTIRGPDITDVNKITIAGSSNLIVTGDFNLAGGTNQIINDFTGDIELDTKAARILYTNGITINSNIVMYFTYVRTLKSNLIMSPGKKITIIAGTLNTVDGANNWIISVGSLSLPGGTLTLGSGTHLITGTSGDLWNVVGTISSNTSTIKFTGGLTGDINFTGGSKSTYYNLWNATTNSYSLIIKGSNTFNNFKIDAGRTVKFTNSTTTTVNTFTALGTSGAHITISNTNSTTHATLAKAGGGVITGCDYIDIQEITGSPDLTWYIGPNSTDAGSTCTNIYLSDAPSFGFSKMNGIAIAGFSKINGIAKTSISKVNGI